MRSHAATAADHSHRRWMLAFAGCASLATVLGAKLWLIWVAANPTPFWDQWDAEAAGLYKPWLEGTWDWTMFVRPHNEHRILPTRLIHLALFEVLDRSWNPLVQMIVNAVLHVAALAMLAHLLASALPAGRRWPVWIVTALLHAVPFGWDNTLQGFNTHFYVLALLSFVLLWLAMRVPCGVAAGAGIAAVAILLALTMASGLLGALVAALVIVCRRVVLAERGASTGIAAVLVAVAIAAYLLTPEIPGHHALRAQSPGELLVGLARTLAWPLRTVGRNALSAAMPVVMQTPALVALAVSFRARAHDRQAFLVFTGMTAWVWLQAAAFSYARYRTGLGSRYLDLLSAGTVLNFVALLYLTLPRGGRLPRAFAGLAILWLAALAFGVASAVPALRWDIRAKAAESWEQERRVRAYLAGGDPKVLFDAKPMEIPYPDPARLQTLLDDRTIRSFLPAGFVLAPAVNE